MAFKMRVDVECVDTISETISQLGSQVKIVAQSVGAVGLTPLLAMTDVSRVSLFYSFERARCGIDEIEMTLTELLSEMVVPHGVEKRRAVESSRRERFYASKPISVDVRIEESDEGDALQLVR